MNSAASFARCPREHEATFNARPDLLLRCEAAITLRRCLWLIIFRRANFCQLSGDTVSCTTIVAKNVLSLSEL